MYLWSLYCLGLVLVVGARRDEYDRIGYFWQITDIHYDPHFTSHSDYKKGCWRHENGAANSAIRENNKRRTRQENMGKFGEYNCDSTWELIESAAKFMKKRLNDNVEFVLWTGDGLSHFATRHLSENHQLELVQALTDLLGKTFPAQFVFPALGHDDPPFRKHLGRMWSRWLPTDSMKTFETGGYYIIERKQLKLQIVVINTNLMKRNEIDEEANKQWKWLEKVLHKFQKNGETVYLVGHVPPGWDERQKGLFQSAHGAFTDYHNKKYLEVVRNYSDIIVGQFFGHLHSDTFRIMMDNKGKAISWAMIAPSITPKRNHMGPNNPGLRLYKFNKDTGQIFDYTQFYLDLSQTNAKPRLEWLVEYNFTSYYGINDINPDTLYSLAKKFVVKPDGKHDLFQRYHKANTVKVLPHPRDQCDISCVLNHYCAITQVDYAEFEDCLIRTAMIQSTASRKYSNFINFYFGIIFFIISTTVM
ncbi:cyclic GMP-AMP phosphodiesterase SMPDL3A-like [Rhynchophorus ferrugineus]|uniref:Sphingomyelin phosphodiesterase C-terminal domain-containing protein n=1 Tax=Rhynchophorus ferrugineus TaxID=354439 RepID=A0A834IQU0_RHYFE|nr:hypothetical protein GWI33_021866 [Rhynchophorus ferrugineus]